MFFKKLRKFVFKSLTKVCILVIVFGFLNTINLSFVLPVAAAVNCPSGTWNGTFCQAWSCPNGGTPNLSGTCLKNICPNGQEPQNGTNCLGISQMLVYACGAGDPNTIFRTTHNCFDSSLCTAPANASLFSQVGSCTTSSFYIGGSRNRNDQNLPYSYNVRSGDGPESFYDTYFGFGD